MLGNKIIGIMESLKYGQDQSLYRQNYEIVGELQLKLREEHERFILRRQEFIQSRERLLQLQKSDEVEGAAAFGCLMQGIADFEVSFLEQTPMNMPLHQGAVILFQKIITACHMDILDELIQYYSVDGMLEQIEVGIKYLGRDEEVFRGLDLYHMLKETGRVIENMSQQIQEYLLLCNSLQQKLDHGLKELEKVIEALPKRRHKKPNFYSIGYQQREMMRQVYEQIKILEKMNKLPLYKGSLGASHLFMDQLMAHLQQVE